MSGEIDLAVLVASMRPELHEGAYEFVTSLDPTAAELAAAVVIVREDEGVTRVREAATDASDASMAWITLTVHSSLQAVGLTAAVATALTEHGIACNVVAAFHHDHLFVPSARRHDAMDALLGLARET